MWTGGLVIICLKIVVSSILLISVIQLFVMLSLPLGTTSKISSLINTMLK